MTSIFSRIFKIGQSEAHSAVDKLENPIKMTEQGIRDLRNDLLQALESFAEVKAMAAKMRRELDVSSQGAAEYEKKAVLLLQRAQAGQLDPNEAERLAREALNRKEQAAQQTARLTRELAQQETTAASLQSQIEKLKKAVSQYENDLTTLKARAKTASAMTKINKQMARIDSSGTLAMLEKMRTKVEEEETLANAYGEIASSETSVDQEINLALAGSTPEASDPLIELKVKMGLLPAASESTQATPKVLEEVNPRPALTEGDPQQP